MTGLVTCPIACALVVVLHYAPRPSAADVAARSKRAPMTSAQRRAFLCAFAPGIALLIVGYAMLTAIRSVRPPSKYGSPPSKYGSPPPKYGDPPAKYGSHAYHMRHSEPI